MATSTASSKYQQPQQQPQQHRKRIQFTHKQKQEIRDFYNSHYQCSAKHLRQWFEAKYGLPLRPSTISTILRASDKSTASSNTIRARLPKYPELENKLRQWVEEKMAATAELGSSNLYITNEMLKSAAQELWKTLPQYQELGRAPSFSEGWIEKFKRRTNMPRLRRQGNNSARSANNNNNNNNGSNSNGSVTANPSAGSNNNQLEAESIQNNGFSLKLPPPSQIISGAPATSLGTPLYPSLPYFKPLPPITSPSTTSSIAGSPPPLVLNRRCSDSSNSSGSSATHEESNIHNILNPIIPKPTSMPSPPYPQNSTLPSLLPYANLSSSNLSSQQQQQQQLAPLIPSSVAKCHLQILKIYMEQQPGDVELKNMFSNLEQVLDARCLL